MKSRIGLIIVLLFCLPVIWPFIQKGYFPTQDGGWAIVRLAEMHREIKDWQFPPRWAGYLNHGYGYPLFLFTYPFPCYIAEIFHLIGFGLIDSIKLIFILSVLGSATGMFYFAKSHWGVSGAVVSSIVYLYAPYRFVNLFIRGSPGESLVLVFFPMLLWILEKIVSEKKLQLAVSGGVLLATFILTHNAMAVLFLPVIGVWILYILWQTRWNTDAIKFAGLTLAMGVLLSAHFWLPAIVEKKYIVLSQIPLARKEEHFLNLRELLSFDWNFNTRPPLQIGLMQLVIPFAVMYGIFKIKENKTKRKKIITAGLFSVLAVFYFFLLFPVSQNFWQLPLFKEVDFPWRVLAVLIFLLAFVSGGITKIKHGFVLSVLVVITVTFFNFNYIKTQPRESRDDVYYETNDATTTSADELMPVWVIKKPANRQSSVFFDPEIQGKLLAERSNYIKINIQSTVQEKVVLNRIYFPGWQAYIDGHSVSTYPDPATGLIAIATPQRDATINLKFKNTLIRQIADMLSATGLVVLFSLWIYSKRYYR